MKPLSICYSIFLVILFFSSASLADKSLAEKLANPVASLVSVPFQYNYDHNFGTDDKGSREVLNIQPVIPISLTEDFNLISRTIVPLIDQNNIPSNTYESGVGDVLQSFFFSPAEPTANGLIWGAGPAFGLATASDQVLGSEKWSVGPTFVALKQQGPWTYGLLTNHLLSYAGSDNRSDINATFLQPFCSYITDSKTTFTLNSESTYDWQTNDWSAPVNAIVSQLFRIANQPMQFSVGARYWVESPDTGPED